MLFSSLLLLLLAAVLHALANVLMKKSQDKIAFAWWMLAVTVVLGSPAFFFIPDAPQRGWIFLIISGVLEALYFLTLTRAYTSGDLSLVYPIARGSAQLFLLLWAVVFLKEHPTRLALLGIACVIVGLYLINLPSIHAWSRPLHAFRTAASRWALLTGILISTYTAVDKVGIQYFPPFIYIYFALFVCLICLSILWFIPQRRAALIQEPKNKRIYAVTAGALFGTAGYTLVLAALKISPASYVGPVREVSVVIGTWIGIRFLSEQGGWLRLVASALVVLGIIFITVFG
ncbi:MAG TPA: DMT family transporter [Acidobacteriota bacterium]|nr:DMT family transporter [Acidobacteriota bacterium]